MIPSHFLCPARCLPPCGSTPGWGPCGCSPALPPGACHSTCALLGHGRLRNAQQSRDESWQYPPQLFTPCPWVAYPGADQALPSADTKLPHSSRWVAERRGAGKLRGRDDSWTDVGHWQGRPHLCVGRGWVAGAWLAGGRLCCSA